MAPDMASGAELPPVAAGHGSSQRDAGGTPHASSLAPGNSPGACAGPERPLFARRHARSPFAPAEPLQCLSPSGLPGAWGGGVMYTPSPLRPSAADTGSPVGAAVRGSLRPPLAPECAVCSPTHSAAVLGQDAEAFGQGGALKRRPDDLWAQRCHKRAVLELLILGHAVRATETHGCADANGLSADWGARQLDFFERARPLGVLPASSSLSCGSSLEDAAGDCLRAAPWDSLDQSDAESVGECEGPQDPGEAVGAAESAHQLQGPHPGEGSEHASNGDGARGEGSGNPEAGCVPPPKTFPKTRQRYSPRPREAHTPQWLTAALEQLRGV